MSGDGGGPDLLASLPAERAGPDPQASLAAALEEMRSGLAALRDEVAGLRRELAAERPPPATRDELDAWGARLAEGMSAATAPEGADGTAIADAADRLDAALSRAVGRLSAEIGMMEGRLAAASTEGATEDGATERLESAASGLESATERLEEAAKTMGETAGREFRSITGTFRGLRDELRAVRGGWRVFLVSWLIFVFILGMALESRSHLLSRLPWWD